MSNTLDIAAKQTSPIRELLQKQLDDGSFGIPDFSGATPHLTIWDQDDGVLLDVDGAFETPVSAGIASVTPPGTLKEPADPSDPIIAGRQWRVTSASGEVEYYPKDGRSRTRIWRTLDSE